MHYLLMYALIFCGSAIVLNLQISFYSCLSNTNRDLFLLSDVCFVLTDLCLSGEILSCDHSLFYIETSFEVGY